jgi:hypothetical protein
VRCSSAVCQPVLALDSLRYVCSGLSIDVQQDSDACVRLTAGFCAVSSSLPLPMSTETEITTRTVKRNGMNASFMTRVHCVAAEPHATFLRVSVTDAGQEVAYESAVLGRLRRGYRVLQLRGMLGTRIEVCFLFLRISFGSEMHLWSTPRQVRTLWPTSAYAHCVTDRLIRASALPSCASKIGRRRKSKCQPMGRRA